MTAATKSEYTEPATTLFLAFELGERHWKLGFTTGFGQKARERTITGRDLAQLKKEIAAAKKRFGFGPQVRVVSCYEAGRDGFWLHRALVDMGIENVIVDSSSIRVDRRKRRAKTDRVDLHQLLTMLMRSDMGEKKVWSVVHVPSEEAEDRRHLHRELKKLKEERTGKICSLKGLLVCSGVSLSIGRDFLSQLDGIKLWNGEALPAGLRQRLLWEHQRLEFTNGQIREIEAKRSALLRESKAAEIEQVRQLKSLAGIGINSAWLFSMEFFSWRQLRNRREVGGLAGLAPTPYNSGDSNREQGIGKDGNGYVRAMAVEIAWCWLRFQPQSELSLWYQRRFGHGSTRLRRIGIVALARKLLIALWRWVDQGVLPPGAVLKPAP